MLSYILSCAGTIVGAYAIYLLVTAWLCILKRGKTKPSYYAEHPTSRFRTESQGNDRIALIDDPQAAGRWRLQLIDEAQHSLDVCYHTNIAGVYADLFFGSLVKAADRGVHVRFITDAMVGGFKNQLKDLAVLMESHPNMELGLYEPYNWAKPWVLNNRLHDKFLIADGQVMITGGRNIGDKLYQPVGYVGEDTFDRDVLVTRNDPHGPSVIDSILEYGETLWNLPYMRKRQRKQTQKAEKAAQRWKQACDTQRPKHPEFYAPHIDSWLSVTVPTNKITAVHNPMGRGSKAPWIWDEMLNLFGSARTRVLEQSPYIVPTTLQLIELDNIAKKGIALSYLTNSLYSSPNIPGFSGYLRQKRRICTWGPVYEYMGPGSIHSKTALVDDDISIVGSFNLDPRSLHLDTETMLVIDSKPFNTIISDITDIWISASATYDRNGGVLPPTDVKIHLHRAKLPKRIIFRIAEILLWPIKMLV